MFIDIPTLVVALLIGVVAWQQYNIYMLQEDVDQVFEKHNDFVEAVDKVFQGILDSDYKGKDDDKD
tara:strand:+ start:3541 stop:3738 length:198 start_codon:yes stop_codon:yes gene_type:complete